MSTPTGDRRATSDRWRAAADALTIVLAALAAIVWWWGRRWTFAGIRVSLSASEVALAAASVAVVRHAFVRRPAIHTSLRRMVSAAVEPYPALRAVLPAWCVTRPTVLLFGLVAVLMVGYPSDSPPRISTDEVWNLPYRWDAAWYVSVSGVGYQWSGAPNVQQNLNFFPALPLLMVGVSSAFSRHIPPEVALAWSGTLVSMAAFLVALVYLYRLFVDRIGEDAARTAALFLAAYPFAVFFSATYSESLYLAGAVAAFYHLGRGEALAAGCWALVVGLARPNGTMLAVPLAIIALAHRPRGAVSARVAAALMPLAGMLAYSAYGYWLTGRPFVWAELQRTAWGRTFHGVASIADVGDALRQFVLMRSATGTRLSDALNGAGALFALVSIWPVTRRLGSAYGVFVALGVLVPLVNGGVDSMGRYTSVLFPSFVWLGLAVPERQRAALAAALAMGQGALAAMFFTWRPIF